MGVIYSSLGVVVCTVFQPELKFYFGILHNSLLQSLLCRLLRWNFNSNWRKTQSIHVNRYLCL